MESFDAIDWAAVDTVTNLFSKFMSCLQQLDPPITFLLSGLMNCLIKIWYALLYAKHQVGSLAVKRYAQQSVRNAGKQNNLFLVTSIQQNVPDHSPVSSLTVLTRTTVYLSDDSYISVSIEALSSYFYLLPSLACWPMRLKTKIKVGEVVSWNRNLGSVWQNLKQKIFCFIVHIRTLVIFDYIWIWKELGRDEIAFD